MATKAKKAKWNKGDDKKLAELFRRGKKDHGIDSKDLSKEYIEKVIEKFFPDRNYKSFNQLYRGKARAFNLGQSLAGGRRGKSVISQCIESFSSNHLFSDFASGAEESKEEKDNQEEKADTNEGKEDSETEAADNQEEEGEEEASTEEFNQHQRVEQNIPRATMTTVTKAPAAGPSSSPFNMNFFFPHILYTYIEEDVRMITIDFLVIGQSKSAFRPRVVSDGHVFQLGMVVPNFFAQEDRLQVAHHHDAGFNEDTHKATALREIVAKYTDSLDAEEPLMGEPMQVKLPFKVEEEIEKWELLAFDNSEEFSTEVGIEQYYFVLTVDLIGVEKVKKEKKAPGFRMLGTSPSSKKTGIASTLFGTPAR
jgi:hypothetical protein